MLRPPTEQGVTPAARRPLKIFASDPLLGRTFGNRARIDIINERLSPGPVGAGLARTLQEDHVDHAVSTSRWSTGWR